MTEPVKCIDDYANRFRINSNCELEFDGETDLTIPSFTLTWTSVASAEANTYRGVVYGNGVWVSVSSSGTSRAMRSVDDGLIWSAVRLKVLSKIRACGCRPQRTCERSEQVFKSRWKRVLLLFRLILGGRRTSSANRLKFVRLCSFNKPGPP